jgi:hypothetical protein
LALVAAKLNEASAEREMELDFLQNVRLKEVIKENKPDKALYTEGGEGGTKAK